MGKLCNCYNGNGFHTRNRYCARPLATLSWRRWIRTFPPHAKIWGMLKGFFNWRSSAPKGNPQTGRPCTKWVACSDVLCSQIQPQSRPDCSRRWCPATSMSTPISRPRTARRWAVLPHTARPTRSSSSSLGRWYRKIPFKPIRVLCFDTRWPQSSGVELRIRGFVSCVPLNYVLLALRGMCEQMLSSIKIYR